MPTTRKEYEKGSPNVRIAKFTSGTARDDYDLKLRLVSTEKVQIRHFAIEAARVSANKIIADEEVSYLLEVKIYPHVILRENKMIATAGADRLQEGMRRAYGKPVALAARVNIGDSILDLSIMKEQLSTAVAAFKTAGSKLPAPMKIEQVILPQKP
jgi:large subunit ribosomal protein L10e|tara:strand:- start:2827 stop:3294 length:468 start_codon:yes stop_codon:yes gene_type:complete